jgi:hypothetical protein
MVSLEERNRLLDEFSTQLKRHLPEAWRSLYEERSGTAKFGSGQRTLVCVEAPAEGPFRRDAVLATLRRLARRHDGTLDPCADEFAFLSFGNPEDALRMAVELQRLVPHARLRVGLVSGRSRIAVCQAAGRDFFILLGEERARVEALTRRAAPGTVQLAVEAYEAVRDTIAHGVGSCILLEAFNGDELTEASLTLPPDPTADLSTFAGLGLT